MGVTYEGGKYRARVSVGGGKRRSLGRFDTKLKAQRAISKYRAEQASEKAKEAEITDHLDKLSLNDEPTLKNFYGIEDPVVQEEPSLWDKIKAKWQSIRQRS